MHRTESIFEPFLYARLLPNIPKTVLASLSAAHALYIFSKSSKIHCDHTKHSVQKMAMQSHQHTYTCHTFPFFTSWKLKEDVSNLLPNQLHRSCKTHTKLLPRAKIKMTPLCPEQSHATTPACQCNETSCIWTFGKNRFLLKNTAFQPSKAIL